MLPASVERQVQTKHLANAESEEQEDQERQHKDCRHFAGGNLHRTRLLRRILLLRFVVMPFDGEEHARAEYEHLERMKTMGNQSVILKVFRLLLDTIQRKKASGWQQMK